MNHAGSTVQESPGFSRGEDVNEMGLLVAGLNIEQPNLFITEEGIALGWASPERFASVTLTPDGTFALYSTTRAEGVREDTVTTDIEEVQAFLGRWIEHTARHTVKA
jgi:hypothetical protein